MLSGFANHANIKAITKNVVKNITPHGIVSLVQRYGSAERVPRSRLYFEIHLTEHCNLNCAGCSHFSSIAKETYLDPAVFERDMQRLSLLTNGQLAYIKLLGGEPLLHPECHTFMQIARKYFNKTAILLLTNGILLPAQNERFWQNARHNNIWIAISHYPIQLDLDAITQLAIKHGVPCGYFRSEADICGFSCQADDDQTMYRFKLDLQGRQNMRRSFSHCIWSNNCFTLRDGKFYTCFMIAHIRHFNDFFKMNVPVTEQDCIDIYKAKNAGEILEFLARPVPFCRFCNLSGITDGHKWSVSKKAISEWV